MKRLAPELTAGASSGRGRQLLKTCGAAPTVLTANSPNSQPPIDSDFDKSSPLSPLLRNMARTLRHRRRRSGGRDRVGRGRGDVSLSEEIFFIQLWGNAFTPRSAQDLAAHTSYDEETMPRAASSSAARAASTAGAGLPPPAVAAASATALFGGRPPLRTPLFRRGAAVSSPSIPWPSPMVVDGSAVPRCCLPRRAPERGGRRAGTWRVVRQKPPGA